MSIKSITILALPALLAIGCRDGDPPELPRAPALSEPAFARFGYDVVPRTYQVPPHRSAEVRRLVRSMSYPITIVTAQGAQTQFVQPTATFTSDRHFVVTAPVHFHPAIEDLLKRLASESEAARSPTYQITYWMVQAEPASDGAITPELAEIDKVLQSLTGLGKRRFRLVDRVSSRVTDGEDSAINGRIVGVKQNLESTPEGVELQVELQAKSAETTSVVETRVRLRPDQAVVLGDSAAAPAGNAGDVAPLVLYVVRAHPVE